MACILSGGIKSLLQNIEWPGTCSYSHIINMAFVLTAFRQAAGMC
jgi:hypothetical protein